MMELRALNGYWTVRWYENGKRKTWTFGAVASVSESRARAALRQRLRSGTTATTRPSNSLTVRELCECYLDHAQRYYQSDGEPTGEAVNVLYALQPLTRELGRFDAALLRPRQLQRYIDRMIRAGVARTTINKRLGIVKRMLKWATVEQLLPATTATGESAPTHPYDAIRDMPGLAIGRSGAVEHEPPQAVDDDVVEATLRYLPPTIQSMIRLQRLTGMRPAEVCRLTATQIDVSSTPWRYEPTRHKTAYRGKVRRVWLGPRARALLGPRMPGRPLTAPIFSADEAQSERAGRLPAEWTGESARTVPTRHIAPRAYRQAIWHACWLAFPAPGIADLHAARSAGRRGEPVPPELARAAKAARVWQLAHQWSPNQLRHAGIEAIVHAQEQSTRAAAQAVAGHSSDRTTRGYLRRHEAAGRLAAEVMERVG